jgi:hypothetical protein
VVQARKVYDYNENKVKNKLVTTLRRRRRESTIADLISDTGLPKYQVENTIKAVSDEYQGHLRATESGEILYYFPHGMRSRYKGFIPGARRFFRRFGKVSSKVLSTLFKVWIMVMLVGYFALFVLILVLAIVASVAGSAAGRGRSSRGGGIFSFYLAMRAFQIFTWIWLTSGTGTYKQRNYRQRGRRLHKSIFAYVFGEEDVNRELNEKEKSHIVSFIRSRNGVLTLDELMVITGREEEEAHQMLNRLLLEWEGEPMVTDNGSLIYFFPELLKSRQEELQKASRLPLLMPEKKKLIPFSNNPKKTNRWITFLNGFNIFFGGYFLYFSVINPERITYLVRTAEGIVERTKIDFAYIYHYVHQFLESLNLNSPEGLIIIALGLVPLAFSALFYLIPFIRNRRNRKENDSIKKDNLRKKIYFHVLGSADAVDPDDVKPGSADEAPRRARQFKIKVLDRLAAARTGEIEQKGKDKFIYHFPEIERELKDVEEYRTQVDLDRYRVGATVFDSGEEQPDM